jgi:Nitroreductase family
MTRDSDLATAVEQALRAPSVHNTQPWRWRLLTNGVELHADRGRHLAATDPDGRDLVLSCGAALHHLRVALAVRGLSTAVARVPDPENTDHLATVTLAAGPPDRADGVLFGEIDRRRTDRRRMSHRPVPAEHLDELVAQARRAGADLVPVTGSHLRGRLVAALADAAERQRWTPGYPAELQLWTRRTAGSHDGVGVASIAPPPDVGVPLRAFSPHGRLTQPRLAPGRGDGDDAATLVVVVTGNDRAADRLRAGEALSAVLLTATRLRLATTPLSQATEVAEAREAVARVLGAAGEPQILVRVGWPASTAEDLPVTPRRDLHSVLLPY